MMLDKVILDSYDQYIDLKISLFKLESAKVHTSNLIKKLEHERPLVEKQYAFTNLLDRWFKHYDTVLTRFRNLSRKKCDIESKLQTLKINIKSQWN